MPFPSRKQGSWKSHGKPWKGADREPSPRAELVIGPEANGAGNVPAAGSR